MTLEELIEKQNREKEDFKRARQKSWQQIKERQEAIWTSLGRKNESDVAKEFEAKFKKEEDQFNKEWANETGTRYKAVTERHLWELDKHGQESMPQQPVSRDAMIEQQKRIVKKKPYTYRRK
jgi:hypothetical protein